jgi:hypothetical protein
MSMGLENTVKGTAKPRDRMTRSLIFLVWLHLAKATLGPECEREGRRGCCVREAGSRPNGRPLSDLNLNASFNLLCYEPSRWISVANAEFSGTHHLHSSFRSEIIMQLPRKLSGHTGMSH